MSKTPPVLTQQASVVSVKPAVQLKQLRRKRLHGLMTRLAVSVMAPTLMAAFYYAFWATPFYVSEAQFVIHSSENQGSPILDSLFGGMGGMSVSDRDARIAKEYILSHDALAKLIAEQKFREIYAHDDIDMFSRLSGDASQEEAFDYYRGGWKTGIVTVQYDSSSGVATASLRAPNSEQAAQLLKALLHYAERIVNTLSDRSREDQLDFARRELARAEERLMQARAGMLEIQNANAELNPAIAASSVTGIKTELEGELAKAQTDYNELRRYLQPTTPQVQRMATRIASLKRQIELENQRLVSSGGEKALNQTIANYESAQMEKEFAQKSYEAALTYMETARAESARQVRYLSIIVPPTVPDQPGYPSGVQNVLTVFWMAFLFYLLASMLIASVREHAKI